MTGNLSALFMTLHCFLNNFEDSLAHQTQALPGEWQSKHRAPAIAEETGSQRGPVTGTKGPIASVASSRTRTRLPTPPRPVLSPFYPNVSPGNGPLR